MRKPEERRCKRNGYGDESSGHHRVNRGDNAYCPDDCETRWERIPGDGVFRGVDGVGRRTDPAGQHAGLFVRKIGRCVANQIGKKVFPDVPGDRNESACRNPPAHAPEEVVGEDQHNQNKKGALYDPWMTAADTQRINQALDRVLGRECASDRCDNAGQDQDVR
jgi:hypothetical protein